MNQKAEYAKQGKCQVQANAGMLIALFSVALRYESYCAVKVQVGRATNMFDIGF